MTNGQTRGLNARQANKFQFLYMQNRWDECNFSLTPSPKLAQLAQGRVGHAEAGPDVFGEKFYSFAIGYGIGFGQILHGFDQHLLAVDVAGIVGADTLLAG